MKKRILTGDRPTGPLHLGHYIGSLKKRVELQYDYDQYLLVADLQALTDNFKDPTKIKKNVMEVVLDYLAVGIDPKITKIVIQSMVPEISELTIYYLNLVTLSRLERNPTVREEIKQKGFKRDIPVGFLAYPVSQAADITAFAAELVPVGEDQLPMLEQAKEIVKAFNRLYGRILVEPTALLSDFPRLPGIDGKFKMSKSLGNVISLSDSPLLVHRQVMKMYTDPTRIHPTDPGHIEGNPVFIYLEAFNDDKEEVQELKERYQKGKVGDVEVKERLARALNRFLEPIRKQRKKYQKDTKFIYKILKKGTREGREIAQETLAKVRQAIGLKYF